MADKRVFVPPPQLTVNPGPQKDRLERVDLKDHHRYLEAAGWRKVGEDDGGNCTWSDPSADDGKTSVHEWTLHELNRDGSKETVRQHVAGTPRWDYPTLQAVSIQRHRDASRETTEQLIERKEKELERLKSRLAKQAKEPAPAA